MGDYFFVHALTHRDKGSREEGARCKGYREEGAPSKGLAGRGGLKEAKAGFVSLCEHLCENLTMRFEVLWRSSWTSLSDIQSNITKINPIHQMYKWISP